MCVPGGPARRARARPPAAAAAQHARQDPGSLLMATLPNRRLGRTGIAVSYPALGCGTVTGSGNTDAEAVQVVHRAIEVRYT